MDTEKVIDLLEWWSKTANAARATNVDPGSRRTVTYAFVSGEHDSFPVLRDKEDQVRRVLKHVLGLKTPPEILSTSSGNYYDVVGGIELATYAIGRLRNDAETRAMIGSSAPTMQADALHPLVWDAASKRWDSGHYSDAVQRAATFLNAHVQDITGRTDVSDNDLMSQTFSLSEPQRNKPRLRWPGDDTNLTVKAMRVGILNLSQGVFSAIRNPATHSTEDMERQEALEQLATLSILARWIDRCDLVSA
ncbi:TIGR02391 family protein [Microbacterium foliorum]|uniref:Conserved hypothetical protein CHP02391 domain-containing protein n=1 Tax=Microbacterium foliorum TaxID=104336 RepID=A0A0F0KRN2_9MICO|nr:TIGR02391 family protein [Microbacterium foliorum]AXL12653.1 TIGR02391 family protein [Microbacterium foliorum]KJL23144.1 Protein of unknown function (Hypoth-ymh) [Microbacterium foliorum]